MRVVVLTQYYPPETGAPQGRLSDLVRRMVAAGDQVHVVTAMPSYPNGRVFDGWRGKLVASELRDGAVVLRSWIWATPSKAVVRQLASYGSFAASAALTAPLRVRRADLVVWESPPLFLAPVAWLLARLLRARLVTNVSDLWPESAVALGMLGPGPTLRALEALERWAYRSSDLVTGQTEGILAGVRQRWAAAPTHLFPNGVDLERYQPVAGARERVRAELGLGDGDVLVGYGGNFGRAQALEQVVRAADLLRDLPRVRFLLLGSGPRRGDVEALADQLRLTNLEVRDPIPREELWVQQHAWDISVVPLAQGDLFHGARPSKMFELMALGLPFVFCGQGEGAEIAAASGAAVVVPAEDPAALAAAIRRLVDEGAAGREARGAAARACVADRFDRKVIGRDVVARLHAVAQRRGITAASGGMGRSDHEGGAPARR